MNLFCWGGRRAVFSQCERARAFVKYDTHGISSYDSTSELLFRKVGIIKVKKTLLLQKVSTANPEKKTEEAERQPPMLANANEFQEEFR